MDIVLNPLIGRGCSCGSGFVWGFEVVGCGCGCGVLGGVVDQCFSESEAIA